MIGYLFSVYHSRLSAVVKAFFTMRFANQLAREEYSLSHPASLILSVNFLLTCSIFILQLISSNRIFSAFVDSDFISFLVVFISVFTVYLVKIISLVIFGFIFDKKQVIAEYIFTIFLVNQIIGIGFIPVIIVVAYGNQLLSDVFIYAGIALVILLFIIRVGKGTVSALSGKEVTPFYLFLYLCTLEILPLLLGWKLIEKLV